MEIEVIIALVGVALGAVIGLGGAALGALGSLRSSQLVTRARLADKLHVVERRLVELTAAHECEDAYPWTKYNTFAVAWNDFATNQKILCPSERLESVLALIKLAQDDEAIDVGQRCALAREACSRAADMIGAHSGHLTRRSADKAEVRILSDWIANPSSVLQELPAVRLAIRAVRLPPAKMRRFLRDLRKDVNKKPTKRA